MFLAMSMIKACSDAKYLDKGSGASCQNLVLLALLFPPLNCTQVDGVVSTYYEEVDVLF